tara:strand:+ start:8864 stop:10000 length:1137 start_codon:yes stop_codon:yes gene_type:complete
MIALSGKYIFVFDIGSATVGVSFAHYQRAKTIEVLFSHREPIHYDTDTSAESLGLYVSAAIEHAGKKALDTLSKRDDIPSDTFDVHAVVHAPWATSRSVSAERPLQKESIITKELLKEFVERNLPVESATDQVAFDSHITQVALNGYVTRNPYKKRASHIAITTLRSFMATPVHEAILDAFWQVFPEHDVHIDAFMYTVLQLAELFGEHDTFTVVDIGGSYTALTTVRNGTITANAWGSFGTDDLINAVAKGDTDAFTTARADIVRYLQNTCTPSQCRVIDGLLTPIENEWAKVFGDACATIRKVNRMPTKTFIIVHKDFFSWFERAIEKIDFGQFTVTGKPPHAEPLHIGDRGKIIHRTEGGRHDTALTLALLFVGK